MVVRARRRTSKNAHQARNEPDARGRMQSNIAPLTVYRRRKKDKKEGMYHL
jgi:hypothetical protein